jgi:hypothetical protein
MPAKKTRTRRPAPRKAAARKKANTKTVPARKSTAPSKKSPAPAKKSAAPARQSAPAAKKSAGAAKGGPVLPFFEWRKNGAVLRVGVLFPFSYDEQAMRRWPDAYPDVETFNAAHGTKLTIARHEVVDRLLQDEVIGGMLAITLAPMLVRGLLVHEAPGKPFAAEVASRADASTPVIVASTGRYAGESGIALWLPDPVARDFVRDQRGVVVDVRDDRWVPVRQPPLEAGWYHLDPKTLVPSGARSDEAPPHVLVVEGDDRSRELVMGVGSITLVPQPERQVRYVIANSAGRAEVGPLVRDSTSSRVSVGYGLGSVTALVEIGDEDASRVTLKPAAQCFKSPFG